MSYGEIGERGWYGAKGDFGNPGPAGRPGRSGVDGSKGIKGAKGAPGFEGLHGLQVSISFSTIPRKIVAIESTFTGSEFKLTWNFCREYPLKLFISPILGNQRSTWR